MTVHFNMTIVEAVTPVFRKVFDDPSLTLTAELTASDVELWDSLNHIMLIVELETLTDLTFSTDQLASLTNVGDFVALIESLGFRGSK